MQPLPAAQPASLAALLITPLAPPLVAHNPPSLENHAAATGRLRLRSRCLQRAHRELCTRLPASQRPRRLLGRMGACVGCRLPLQLC